MRIGINASFLRKQQSGIGQVTSGFLKDILKKKDLRKLLPARGLSKQEKIEVYLYLEEDIPISLPDNFHKRIFLPPWRRDDLIRKIWWEGRILPKKAVKDQCDLFISLYQCPTVLDKTIPHIMVVHDIIPRLFPAYLNNARKRAYWKLTEKAIKKADKIISISKRTEKDLIQHLHINPSVISAAYIDVDDTFKKRTSQNQGLKTMRKYGLKPGYIYGGIGLEMRKNVEGVVRAYKYLLERNKNEHFMETLPKLVISGKLMPQLAPLVTDAEKLVRELNLTRQVKLLDFIPPDHLPALYKNASLFLFPSHYEGFGMPVLEAMNQGVPVITAKGSSLPEVGRDSVLYCNSHEVRDIAMVMKNVLMNKNLRETLARKGKERATYFSWDVFTKKVFIHAGKLYAHSSRA